MDSLLHLISIIFQVGIAVLIVLVLWKGWTSKQPKDSEDDSEEPSPPRICRECGYDLRASGVRCPECGSFNVDRRKYMQRLGRDWPSNPIALRTPAPDEKLELILSTSDFMEASLLRDQLIARGVNCMLESGNVAIDPATAQQRREYQRVMVFSGDLEFAREYHGIVQGLVDSDK